MKEKFLLIALAMSSITFSQLAIVDSTCIATTTKGTNCKIVVKNGDLCRYHSVSVVKTIEVKSVVCGGNTSKNTPCKNKTKHESGKCHHHRD